MYLIKTKGSSIIPEYIQLRNNEFVLISHFRVDNAHSAIEKIGLNNNTEEIVNIIKGLSFGVLYKVNIL